VVPTNPFMYIFEYDLAFIGCDASLKDTRYTLFVELTLDYCKGFGTASNSTSFDWILWELFVYQVR
jgi:hypothetical protein